MSLFIGLPNLNLTNACIEVYPDHIEFGGSEHNGCGVSVYLSYREMESLGKALTAQATDRPGRIITAESSSRDATTDEISEVLDNG